MHVEKYYVVKNMFRATVDFERTVTSLQEQLQNALPVTQPIVQSQDKGDHKELQVGVSAAHVL